MKLYDSIGRTYLRGDVYYADLDTCTENIGSEQHGRRPVVIIQNDIGNRFSPTVIVAIVTSRHKKPMPTHIVVDDDSVLPCKSLICTEQIRTLDKSRLGEYCGRLGKDVLAQLDRAVGISLGIKRSVAAAENEDNDNSEIKEHIKLMDRKTLPDDSGLDLLSLAMRQMTVFENIRQNISDLNMQLEQADEEIEDILCYIEHTNYNAAQGFRAYKLLRDKRLVRRRLLDELHQLEAFVSSFDCEQMSRCYQSAVSRMQLSAVEQPVKAVVGLD